MFQGQVEAYTLLVKNLQGNQVAELITKATSDPSLFVFGELLSMQQIQQLKDNQDVQKQYDLLELFAFGTLQQYSDNSDKYPQLNKAQLIKLKALTICSLANAQKVLEYKQLMQVLGISDIRELEDFLINECIYKGLIKGKLDQKNNQFVVKEVFSRDVSPQQYPLIDQQLQQWEERTSNIMQTVENLIKEVQAQNEEKSERHQYVQDQKQKLNQEIMDEVQAINKFQWNEMDVNMESDSMMTPNKLNQLTQAGLNLSKRGRQQINK